MKKRKLTADERIYNFLDFAERVATRLAKKNAKKIKKSKKEKKRNKKICKLDKTTGACTLKPIPKAKQHKSLKRYK